MTDQLLEYEKYLTPEQSVRIVLLTESSHPADIPATVLSVSGDFVEIELDPLDADGLESIDSEYLVELRTHYQGSAFRCRALLIGERSDHLIQMRLVGNVIFEELREFFRIDTYLTLRYLPLPDHDEKTVLRIWMEISDSRAREAREPASYIYRGEPDTTPSSPWSRLIPLEHTTPVAANISGGGLRTNIPEQLQPGTKAILELYLPGKPPRIIDVVGEVLSSAYVHSEDGGRTFSTPFKFTHLNGNERDEIIRYIHMVQQKQMRKIADDIPQGHLVPDEQGKDHRSTTLRQIILRSLLAVAIVLATLYLFNLYQHREKSEVQLIFEGGLKRYLEKIFPP